MQNIIGCIFVSFLVCYDNVSLLNDLYYNTDWKKYNRSKNNQEIYVRNSSKKNVEYIKIEQVVEFDKQKLFASIKNLKSYDEILSNKKISTQLVHSEEDTLYGYQLISNMIPFIRNRQYVFKMYMINENRLDWILVNKDSMILSKYLDRKNNTLVYGAGSWEMSNDNLLTFRIYVDDEVNIPNRIIKRIRINSVLNSFNDIIQYIK